MYAVKVNEKFDHKVALAGEHTTIDGKEVKNDIVRIDENRWHIIREDKTYHVEVLSADQATKEFVLKVNGNRYELKVSDELDQLLARLGLDKLAHGKVNEVKAPMPGLVLKVLVEKGTAVKKGDGLIVLEAMKMENVIKSPADGTVASVEVNTGVPVEKNQVLIRFS